MGAHTAKFSEVDFRRHDLRDGSGKMWPERCIDRDPCVNIAEVRPCFQRSDGHKPHRSHQHRSRQRGYTRQHIARRDLDLIRSKKEKSC